MNHLTEQQILECVAGTGAEDSRRHLEQCVACCAEVNRFEGAIRGFVAAVDQAALRPAPPIDWAAAGRPEPPAAWVPGWRLAVAALALVLLAAPMFHFNFYPNHTVNTANTTAHNQQQLLERERADVALLEQVDAAVSRPVPQPIEPLVQLVAWGSQTNNSGVTE